MKLTKKENAKKIITLAAYPVIWALCIACFWVRSEFLDAMGYSLIVIWFLIPFSTAAVSFFIGKKDYLGKLKYASPLFFGTMYMLLAYLTFSLANTLQFGKLNKLEPELFAAGVAISLISLIIGVVFNYINKDIQKECKSK